MVKDHYLNENQDLIGIALSGTKEGRTYGKGPLSEREPRLDWNRVIWNEGRKDMW